MKLPDAGTQPARNLPVAPEPGPPASPRQSAPGAPAAVYSGQPDLADAARRGHSERRARGYLIAADYLLRRRVKHPDGGDSPVADILRDEQDQRDQIQSETSQKSRKHDRLADWLRLVPKLVLFFDFCLLLYFFAGITNVDWGNPLSASLAFATVLAAMVTVLSYGALTFTGHRMRSHKNDAGAIHFDELDGSTKAALGGAIVVVAVLATLMFNRMHTEIVYALGSQAGLTALVIPLAVAVVSVVANLLVVAVHAHDGSDETARLRKLARAARRHVRKAHRLQERAAHQASRGPAG